MESCRTMDEWEKAVGIYEHRGIKFSWLTPSSTWKELKQFQVRKDDIFVISYPKSGSHWLKEIIQLLHNGAQTNKLDQSNLNTTLEMCKEHTDTENSIPGYKKMNHWDSPRIISTHCFESLLPPQVWEKKPKVIYVVRNPKDLAVSVYHYVSQILPFFLLEWGAFIDYFLSDNFFTGSWFQHVRGYIPHMKESNFHLVKYEDLYKDLKSVITEINDHLGRPFPRDDIDRIVEASSFAERKKCNEEADKKAETKLRENKKLSKLFGTTHNLRKSNVGEWREFFNTDINDKFDNAYRVRMHSSGLTLDFDM